MWRAKDFKFTVCDSHEKHAAILIEFDNKEMEMGFSVDLEDLKGIIEVLNDVRFEMQTNEEDNFKGKEDNRA
ncbi:hypothetical protein C943_03275 [Mariniradius saccharolyticus AK6]|uniref:Uncharacterized protein n=2 Tax=Mariniradius TaxID=1245590 RepID=M7XJ53_9BACT|nr:hypothetical protein C943_03275 [Mariniradius saccharolyticus AK6]